MAGLPKAAEIAKTLSTDTGPAPTQVKAPEADSQQTSSEASTETGAPASADGGQASSPDNRIPYDRFKEVNEKLKDAHETIANFERRFQTLEQASDQGSGSEEATQTEPSMSDKITQMIEDGDIGEGAADLMRELAAKSEGSAQNARFVQELQLERATKELASRIDGALKGATVADGKGARLFLAQTLQNNPNADLKETVVAWVDWEAQYEKQVFDRYGLSKPEQSSSDEGAETEESDTPAAPARMRGGGSSTGAKANQKESDSSSSLMDIRRNLSKKRRLGK